MTFPGDGSFSVTNKYRHGFAGQTAGHKIKNMKVRASIKKRSNDCKIVRRKGKLYVINKKNPRFKQRQG